MAAIEGTNGRLRAVVFWDETAWVGMCLEHYIGTQAETIGELLSRMACVVEAERQESLKRNGAEFAGIEPAPQRFYQMWEKATPFRANIEDRVELALCA